MGREQQFRFFNNFIVKAKLTDLWSLSFSSDVGFQKKPASTSYSTWYVETLLSQLRLNQTWTLGGRIEYFNDRDQVVATTATANGFQATGASLNLDWQPENSILVRTEIRSLFSTDAVFPSKSTQKKTSTLFVTSLSFSL